MKIETNVTTKVISTNTLVFTVTAQELYLQFIPSLIAMLGDLEEGGKSFSYLFDTMRDILFGTATLEAVKEFFYDGYSMMAIPDVCDYLEKHPELATADFELAINGPNACYKVPGGYINY